MASMNIVGTLTTIIIVVVTQILVKVQSEVVVQIGVSKPVNLIDDHYIGYTLDPQYLLDNYQKFNTEKFQKVAKLLGPTYIKLEGPSLAVRRNESNPLLFGFHWEKVFDWISNIGRTPIVALPYSPNYWHPTIMDILISATQNSSLRNAVWQLGSDFTEANAETYSNDLKSLRTIVNAFSKDYDVQWDVVSASLSAGSCPDETAKYSELIKYVVKAVGWSQSNAPTLENRIDPALKTLFRYRIPVWLTAPPHMFKEYEVCTNQCIMNGLRWAQLLGDSAQSGFNSIFKPMTYREFDNSNFAHYITKVHKSLIGVKVFSTKVTNAREKFDFHLYAHCARNVSGGFVIMAVNQAEVTQKISTKMPLKLTGQEISQYILTVSDGVVHLNDEPMNVDTSLVPQIQIKRPARFVGFVLPPLSVGFWMFPMAEVRECYGDFFDLDNSIEKGFTDSKVGQLLVEALSKNQENRNRRHLENNAKQSSSSCNCERAKRFTFESSHSKPFKAGRRFGSKFLKSKSNGKIRPKRQIRSNLRRMQPYSGRYAKRNRFNNPLVSSLSDAYSLSSTEKRTFSDTVNPSLPTGDVYFKVGKAVETKRRTNPDYDYVEFDENEEKKTKTNSRTQYELPMESTEHQVGSAPKITDTSFEFAPRVNSQSGKSKYNDWTPSTPKVSSRYPKNKITGTQWENDYEIKMGVKKNAPKYRQGYSSPYKYLPEYLTAIPASTSDFSDYLMDDDENAQYVTDYGHRFPSGITYARTRRHVNYDGQDYEFGDYVSQNYEDNLQREAPYIDYSGELNQSNDDQNIEDQIRSRRSAFRNRRTLNKTRRYPRGRYLGRLSRRRPKRNACYDTKEVERYNYIDFDRSHEWDSSYNQIVPDISVMNGGENIKATNSLERTFSTKESEGLLASFKPDVDFTSMQLRTGFGDDNGSTSETPDLVKSVSHAVNYVMQIISKHVSGWWDMFKK